MTRIIAAASFLSHPIVFGTSIVEVVAVVALLPTLAMIANHLFCHHKGCYRLGRFSHGQYKLCHVHHPNVPSDGKIGAEHIGKVVDLQAHAAMLVEEQHYLAHHGRPHPRVEHRLDRGEARTPTIPREQA